MTSTHLQSKGIMSHKATPTTAQATNLFSLPTLLISMVHAFICLCDAGNNSRALYTPKEKTVLVCRGRGWSETYSQSWRLCENHSIKCSVFGENALLVSSVVIFFSRKQAWFGSVLALLCVMNMKFHPWDLMKALDLLLDSVLVPLGPTIHCQIPQPFILPLHWWQTPMLLGAFCGPSFFTHPLGEHHHSHIFWT